MTIFLADLRHSLRALLRSTGFTAIAVLTLALGIGANTALFSVINGVLLNPLPYPHSDQLVSVSEKRPGVDQAPPVYLNFLDWRRQTRTFSSVALFRNEDYNYTGAIESQRVRGQMISAGTSGASSPSSVLSPGRTTGITASRAGSS